MRQEGLVSVITATYNMAEHVAETVEAVLAQDYGNLEAIVVDDGSTDSTRDVLDRFRSDPRVRIIRQENAGQTRAKNRGVEESRGEFVAFCDADDVWRADKLSKQIPRFEDPRVAVVFSDIVCIDGQGGELDIPPMRRSEGKVAGALLIDNFVPFPTAVVRGSVLDEMGGFDEHLSMSIDYDLWLRIAVDHEFAYVREPLAYYRIWAGQMSKNTGERLDNFFRLLERYLRRHPDVATRREIDRAWAHVHVTRGSWHSDEGRRSEAWSDLSTALRLDPMDRRLWRSLARFLLKRKAKTIW